MMIIVGKNGDVGGTIYPNSGIHGEDVIVPNDKREKDGAINIFTPEGGNEKPVETIRGRDASNIIKDYDSRTTK